MANDKKNELWGNLYKDARSCMFTHYPFCWFNVTNTKGHIKLEFQVQTSKDENVDLKDLAYSPTSEDFISLLSCSQ
jgi:hypothetical protein